MIKRGGPEEGPDMAGAGKAGPAGRVARLALGICLAVVAWPVFREADLPYLLSSLGLLVALAGLYAVLHRFLAPPPAGPRRWIAAVLAVIPAFLVWWFGQGGGILFGEGEGGTAALSFLAVSYLVDFARGEAGCEVMALPGLIFGNRGRLPCLLLFPIDQAEGASRWGAGGHPE